MIATPGDESEYEEPEDEKEDDSIVEQFRALITEAVREISGSRIPEIIVNVPPVQFPPAAPVEPRARKFRIIVTARDKFGDLKEATIEALP